MEVSHEAQFRGKNGYRTTYVLHEITYKEAMEIYGLSESCAHKYMTDYKYQISMLISYVK